MSPVGLTRDSGWQIGVRRTLPISLVDAWELLFSPEGLRTWLGDLPGFQAGENAAFELPDGTTGEFKIFQKHSHVRLRWHPPGYPRPAITQVRVIPAGADRTVIAFHQEHLPDEQARKLRKRHFQKALAEIEKMIANRPKRDPDK